MRVATYTRLSPNPDKEDTINQERDLKEYASRQGWDIIVEYKDIHVSGSKKGEDRKEFSRMMQDASKKKFDVLLFWSLDRLTREGVYRTHKYLEELGSYGVEYKSYTEPYLDSCGMFKDVMISMMATLAKQERARLIDRTKAGLRTAKEKGIKLGRAYATTATKKRPKPVSLGEVIKLRGEGLSMAEIGKRVKCSAATVFRLLAIGEKK